MIRILRNDDLALRFYGNDFAILCQRTGERYAFEGPLVPVMRGLAEELGVSGLSQLLENDVATGPDEQALLEHLRGPFDALARQTEPTSLGALFQHAPRLPTYATQRRIPLTGMCEVTYRCNLRCQHCYVLHKVKEERPAHASEENILQLLQSLDRLGCLDVSITGGESTLHRGYLTFVSAAKSLQFRTSLKTNATTFTRARAEEYARDPAHETDVSLYGSTAETHDLMTAVAGSFEKTLAGMRELARVGIRCKVNCTVWQGNVNQLDEMERLTQDMGHYIVFDDIIHGRLDGDRAPLALRVSPLDRVKLVEQGRLKAFKASPCVAGHMKVKIDAEGGIATCELFPGGYGNAHAQPLEQLWQLGDFSEDGATAMRLSTRETENGKVINSCPGLNLLNTGMLAGKTHI